MILILFKFKFKVYWVSNYQRLIRFKETEFFPETNFLNPLSLQPDDVILWI